MNCITCQEKLKTRDQKKFCSKSCAAKYNNKVTPKRARTSLRKCKTEECQSMLYSNLNGNRSFCPSCIDLKRHYHGMVREEATIEEVIKRRGTNTYDSIRGNCHTQYKQEKKNPLCEHCGYNKHIEICHIRPISSFPKDTKLKVVNARENILFLCPNCHWEFDHNLLSLNEIRVVGVVGHDPTAFRL